MKERRKERAKREQKDEGFRRWRARGYLRRESDQPLFPEGKWLSAKRESRMKERERNRVEEGGRARCTYIRGRGSLPGYLPRWCCYEFRKRRSSHATSLHVRSRETSRYSKYAEQNIIENESVYKAMQKYIFLNGQVSDNVTNQQQCNVPNNVTSTFSRFTLKSLSEIITFAIMFVKQYTYLGSLLYFLLREF